MRSAGGIPAVGGIGAKRGGRIVQVIRSAILGVVIIDVEFDRGRIVDIRIASDTGLAPAQHDHIGPGRVDGDIAVSRSRVLLLYSVRASMTRLGECLAVTMSVVGIVSLGNQDILVLPSFATT